MADLVLESGLNVLAFARHATLGFISDIPPDKLHHQPTEGGNHALWILGHLAVSDDLFLSKLGGTPAKCAEDWFKRFGMGSKPSPNAKDYPPVAEVKDHLAARREDLLVWFKSMDEAKLRESLPAGWTEFAPTYAGLMFSMAWHEGLHGGQLTIIRKSLGLAPKFG